jgi:hypothetical protein
MRNILKQEAADLLKVFSKNKGIVIYVTVFSLLVFLMSFMMKSRSFSVAYLVCALGSLLNLSSCEPRREKREEDSNQELVCGLKKIFYVIVFTVVSLGFLCARIPPSTK